MPAAEPFDNALRCPNCGGHDVQASYIKLIRDHILAGFHGKAYRCQACGRRSYPSPSLLGETPVDLQKWSGAPVYKQLLLAMMFVGGIPACGHRIDSVYDLGRVAAVVSTRGAGPGATVVRRNPLFATGID
ncbi:MAG: hypothetical protein WAM39_22760 [Bryobacteraceae bacterium]